MNFSRNPLALGCYFDPRELFYNAGLDDYSVQWSYDFHSTIKALENFINGTGTYTLVKFPVSELLKNDPVIIINFDKKSYDNLIHESEKQKESPEALLKTLLKVTNLQIVCL